MPRLPWWRIVLLLVAAVAIVWWIKHRTRQAEHGSEVRVATVVVAPVDGQADAYRLTFGDHAWEVPWAAADESEEKRAAREARLDAVLAELETTSRGFRLEHSGFEKARIVVAAEHRGIVPFGLTARVLTTLIAAGYEGGELGTTGG